MIAIEGIPRSMYHGPMLVNYSQGVPGFVPQSLNGGLQHPGFYFGEQKASVISPQGTFSADETDKKQPQWREALKQRKEYSTFKKVVLVLQDNRLKTGDPKTAEKLRELNRSQSESCPLLKTMLNVLLVSTAVVLLVAVIVVIIYTSVKSPNSAVQQADNHHQSKALHQSSSLSSSSSSASSSEQSPSSPADDKEDEVKIYEGEFKPRTEMVRSSSVKCRMIPVVYEEEGSVNLRQLCFEVNSNETL